MKNAFSSRKLESFHLHAHRGSAAVSDYSDIFRTIAATTSEERILEKGEHIISLSTCEDMGNGNFQLIAHEGEPGLRPLILDLADMSERSNRLGQRELLTTRTHCIVNPSARKAVIEYNQRGVKADNLSNFITSLGQRYLGQDFVFEFTPQVRSTFWDDVEKLGRVRLASITVVRPNMAWTDDAQSLIDGLEDSSAQRLSLEISARPSESLSRREGLLHKLRRLISQGTTSIKQAKIVGTVNDSQEVTVKLVNHIESRIVKVKRDLAGHPDSSSLLAEIETFLKVSPKMKANP